MLSHSTGYKLAYIDLFPAIVPILYPLKTPRNQKLPVFSEVIKWEQMARNGLIKLIIPFLENFIFIGMSLHETWLGRG